MSPNPPAVDALPGMLERLAPSGTSLVLTRSRPGCIDAWLQNILFPDLPRHALWSDTARRLAFTGAAVGWVPDHQPLFFFNETVLAELAAARCARRNTLHAGNRDTEMAGSLLKRLGIAHLADRSPYTLSRGETKLVWFLLQYAKSPRWLLLDHLPSGLSPSWQQTLTDFIGESSKEDSARSPSWILGTGTEEDWYRPLLSSRGWQSMEWKAAQKIMETAS